jgi:hypothetical protein
MHPMAYGLDNDQRECLVKMAKSNCYYEAYLADRFGISIIDVRDICSQMGNYVCKRVKNGKHCDGYNL